MLKNSGENFATDIEVNNADNNQVPVKLSDSGNLDAFGRIRISQPYSLFENKFVTSKNHHRWDENVFGAIMIHGAVTGTFSIGQTVTGGTSLSEGTITSIDSPTQFTYNTDDNEFVPGETITTATGSATITSADTGANVLFQYYRASVGLNLGTIAGQKVIRQTRQYFPYTSGLGHLINTTQVFEPPKVNLKQTVMYGDELNGIGLVVNGLDIELLLRSNTSGVPVDTLVPQANWNLDTLDPLDGSARNPSGIELDITKDQIQAIDFQWLGVGRVRHGLNIGGTLYYIHESNHANISDGVYMRTPSLPVRYEIENTGTTGSPSQLEQICAAVISEGGTSIPGFRFSMSNGATLRALVAGVKTPILAVRLKNAAENGGLPVRRAVRLLNSGLFATANNVYFEIEHLHTLKTFTGTWQDVDDSSSLRFSVDVTALTAQHIHDLEGSVVPAGGSGVGNAAPGSDTVELSVTDLNSILGQNIRCDSSDIFVVYGTAIGGAATASAHITTIESE